ncbi:MAG: PEP/pyruvate-binding domain-containing protein, partial [bacterium]
MTAHETPRKALEFGAKAETLEAVAPLLSSARVLPQIRFSAGDWRNKRDEIIEKIRSAGWLDRPLIVRSSARREDQAGASLAGHFLSIPDIEGLDALAEGVDAVAASMGTGEEDQVFVQPMLRSVTLSGVAFSCDPSTGAPYLLVNYDQKGSTDSITSGASNEVNTYYHFKSGEGKAPPLLAPIVALMAELESLFGAENLDVEFAQCEDGALYLLQVRPLAGFSRDASLDATQEEGLRRVSERIKQLSSPHPYLYGARSVFGVMPDWNPAEIIGARPRPLALSLYKELVTDNVWAYQRNNYGYKNLRSFPLVVSFLGLPYIDVRVSFNSFLPADIDDRLSERLINYYIDRLIEAPSSHDKVEFDIIFSCYTLDLPTRLEVLRDHGFQQNDIDQLSGNLRTLTNRIIHGETGLWRTDHGKIDELSRRQESILTSSLDPVSKIYWLLEHCKRYGTLPFAGLARAAFIAVQMLHSLIATGVMDEGEYDRFMRTLNTVGSRMSSDFNKMTREEFLRRYGHLRPGTYDILSPRYDEEPDHYFDWSSKSGAKPRPPESFDLSAEQMQKTEELLTEHGLEHDPQTLLHFIKAAIEGREYAKFVFTRSLSEAMAIFKKFCGENGLSPDDCSYADIRCIANLYSSANDPKKIFAHFIDKGRRDYALTERMV